MRIHANIQSAIHVAAFQYADTMQIQVKGFR